MALISIRKSHAPAFMVNVLPDVNHYRLLVGLFWPCTAPADQRSKRRIGKRLMNPLRMSLFSPAIAIQLTDFEGEEIVRARRFSSFQYLLTH